MGFEIERKWLVKHSPPLENVVVMDRICQAYVLDKEGVVLRVRATETHRNRRIFNYCGFVTVKGSTGEAGSNREYEMVIPHDLAETLIGACTQKITKIRYHMPYGPYNIELDVFEGKLDGLVVAEVEFESKAARDGFVPPDWFGVEVTGLGQYANSNLIKMDSPPVEP